MLGVAGCWLAGVMAVQGGVAVVEQQVAPAPPPTYKAFRAPKKISAEEKQRLDASLAKLGVKSLHTFGLDYHGIIVFEAPQKAEKLKQAEKLVSKFIPVPVQAYQGLLSVHTGYFLLRFETSVTQDEARRMLSASGFRILNPSESARGSLIVEGSRMPSKRSEELSDLEKLPGIVYVSPNDIPLPLPRQTSPVPQSK